MKLFEEVDFEPLIAFCVIINNDDVVHIYYYKDASSSRRIDGDDKMVGFRPDHGSLD